MTTKAIAYSRKVTEIERRAVYYGWTDAKERAVAKLWRMFSAEITKGLPQ